MTALSIILAIAATSALALAYIFFMKPVKGIRAMEKLQSQPGPTARHLHSMADTDTIFGWADDLVNMGARRPGTPEGLQAQTYVKEKLESFGLDEVEILPSETYLWEYRDWSLKVGGEEIPSHYISNTLNGGIKSLKVGEAPAAFHADIDSDIVYVGKGAESDFKGIDVKGKIVMAEVEFSKVPISLAKAAALMFYDPDREVGFADCVVDPYSANTFPYNYFRAMAGGAAGFVGILTDYINSNRFNNEDYTYLGSDMAMPGLWVTKADGERIKAKLRTAGGAAGASRASAGISAGASLGADARASMKMSVDVSRVRAGAVIGKLYGKSDEILMVQSHYDSSTPGGTEDASGTAVVLAMAEFFGKMNREELDRTIFFTLMDTHFTDYDSHDSFKYKYLKEDHKVLADVSIEHIARQVREVNGEIIATDSLEPRIIFIDKLPALVKIAKEEIVRHRFGKVSMMPTTFFKEPPTDAEQFHEVGVPIISLISGPIYLYDDIDTADKIAREELRPTAETFSDIVWRLSKLPASSFR